MILALTNMKGFDTDMGAFTSQATTLSTSLSTAPVKQYEEPELSIEHPLARDDDTTDATDAVSESNEPEFSIDETITRDDDNIMSYAPTYDVEEEELLIDLPHPNIIPNFELMSLLQEQVAEEEVLVENFEKDLESGRDSKTLSSVAPSSGEEVSSTDTVVPTSTAISSSATSAISTSAGATSVPRTSAVTTSARISSAREAAPPSEASFQAKSDTSNTTAIIASGVSFVVFLLLVLVVVLLLKTHKKKVRTWLQQVKERREGRGTSLPQTISILPQGITRSVHSPQSLQTILIGHCHYVSLLGPMRLLCLNP